MHNFLDLLSCPNPQNGPVPFWFLNDTLSRQEISRQLSDFHAHGIPGVVIHPRMGFDASVPYLSPLFMDWMEYICETAQSLSMFVYLYDEGMYPSGSACGQVVQENPAFAAKALEMTSEPAADGSLVAVLALPVDESGEPDADHARVIHSPSECLPNEVVRFVSCVFSHGTIRGLHPEEDDGAPHAPAAADLLNPDAVACFIRLTHDRYYAKLSRFFGSTVRAMFTDEPSPLGRNVKAGLVSWTHGMEREWTEAGFRLSDLALLFLPGERAASVRADHAQLVRTHMMRTYYQPLHDWCTSHGIALTGHPAWPDAMDMEDAFTIPGQDLVWGWVAPGETSLTGPESTLAQCAADAALHTGRPMSLCECFGCCGPKESQWGLTMSTIKWMADWLFVRGISCLVPHAFFYSLRLPEARADRPPDVGPNNIFWPYYTDFSTYTARLSTFNLGRTSLAETVVLTDGISLDYNTARELYTRQIPFHYLMISQLLHAEMDGACLHVPGQNITLILVPDSLRLTDAARTCLTAFQAAGGRVVFTDAPEWTQCLSAVRVPIRFTDAPDLRISWQKREDAQYVLLVNEGNECLTSFSLPQEQQLEIMDAWTGTREDRGSVSHGEIRIRALQSLILRFSAPDSRKTAATQVSPVMKTMDISHLLSKPVCSDLSTHTMTYTLTLPDLPESGPVFISFGAVHDLAVITCGKTEKHLLIAPWETDLSDLLSAHPASLTIAVTGARVTEMDGIPWPCGLEGPVLLHLPECQ